MKKLTRPSPWLLAATLLLVVNALVPFGASGATGTKAAASSLNARLGGSKQSFQAAFGAPVKSQSSPGADAYEIKGFGEVTAAFLASKADDVTIVADRLSHTPLAEADPVDWTIANAARFADAWAPADATYGDSSTSKDWTTIIGHSKALERVFTEKNFAALHVSGNPGDFAVAYNLDAAGKVFSIDLRAGSGFAPATTPTTSASAAAVTASTALDSSTPDSGSSNGNVMHCRDFQTRSDAQAYFDAHNGGANPMVRGMDGDKDGKACEQLP